MADRHQFRADWHEYNEGIYFVTICCADKKHYFGEISSPVGARLIAPTSQLVSPTCDTHPRLITSKLGELVIEQITNIPKHYDNVELWNYVVMPNHIHLVICIKTNKPIKASNVGCLRPPQHGQPCENNHHNSQLATIIGTFKAGITRLTRARLIAPLPVWQSRFHEHIIRNQRAFDSIMNYIDTNVENWCFDRFNSKHIDNADAQWRVPTNNNVHEA